METVAGIKRNIQLGQYRLCGKPWNYRVPKIRIMTAPGILVGIGGQLLPIAMDIPGQFRKIAGVVDQEGFAATLE